MTHATRALQSHDLSGEGINSGSHTYFFDHTRTWRVSPDEWSLNAGATSETTPTWKTIHTIHAPIQSNKANMKGWLWRPNDIQGPCGPKASRFSSYRWGKTPKKPHPGNLSRPGIQPGPAAWQARMLQQAPQRWTNRVRISFKFNNYFIQYEGFFNVSRTAFYWSFGLSNVRLASK